MNHGTRKNLYSYTTTVNNNKKDREKKEVYTKEDLKGSLNQYAILNRSQVPLSNKGAKIKISFHSPVCNSIPVQIGH